VNISRDFDSMLAEKAGINPTFKIGGQEFSLRAKLPYRRWNALLAAMRDPDATEQDTTERFFNTVLIKADRERFLNLLNNPDDDDDDDNVIDLSQMDQLTDWIMEHFTGKHRNSSDSSSLGVNGTGARPKPVSLSSRNGAS
jgi:hypothetical protein